MIRILVPTKMAAIAATFAFASGAMVAFAAERTISQKGRAFSETEITLSKDETILFVNDDDVTHNVISTSAGNEFNLGAQAPGVSTPVTFKTAGEVKVRCAIHPRMQLIVKVKD
jgi:plastocyanin